MAVLRQLIEVQTADVNALVGGGVGLLHAASSHERRLKYVTYLLSLPGIEVNLREHSQAATALHLACGYGNQAAVRELLQHPATDVSIKSHDGTTALYLACLFDQPAVVAQLLVHPGIDINQTFGQISSTTLHLACMCGHAGVVRELLKHPDIRVNQKKVKSDGGEGRSALLCCHGVREDSAATLEELIKHPDLDRAEMHLALQLASILNGVPQLQPMAADL